MNTEELETTLRKEIAKGASGGVILRTRPMTRRLNEERWGNYFSRNGGPLCLVGLLLRNTGSTSIAGVARILKITELDIKLLEAGFEDWEIIKSESIKPLYVLGRKLGKELEDALPA